MQNSLALYFLQQPILKVIKRLIKNPEYTHLRDLSRHCNLSPAGVSDIIRRLREIGVLKQKLKGNKKYLTLTLESNEKSWLMALFEIQETNIIKSRAQKLGKHAAAKLQGMDEMYLFYKKLKKK